MSAELRALIARAHRPRAHLQEAGTTLYRAVHTGETGGAFSLERAGTVGVLSLYRDFTPGAEGVLAASCGEALGLTGVFLKRRPREARHLANVERGRLSPPEPAWGEGLQELTVLENGVPFLIRPGADLSIGLFSDARPARAWLRENAAGRVLNTFAYTCGFGVMAALGGAAVVNLDASRRVLDWGRGNYALSGLNAPRENFIAGDVFDWLARWARRGETFDTVVLDPPSFARGKRGMWRAEQDYARLVQLAAQVIASGGRLLALTNHAGVGRLAFGREVLGGLTAAGRTGHVLERLGAGEDYPGAARLKGLAVQLDERPA